LNSIDIIKYTSKDGREHQGKALDEKNGYTVIDCETCGFNHIIPLPVQSELDEFYKDDFYIQKTKYISNADKDSDWLEMQYKDYYQILGNHLPDDSRKILEIGSGPGHFLKCGKELGWDVVGFEPSKHAYENSKLLEVEVINLPFNYEESSKYGKFDAIFLRNVVEHITDPVGLIDDIRRSLKVGGLLLIIAPNDYNPLQNMLKSKLGFEPYWVVPPEHINYFNFDSMKNLLNKLNFEILETSSTFPMEFFLLSGKNYIGNDKLGRECHEMRKRFEFNCDSNYLDIFYKFLAENEMGREFIIIGKKIR